MECCLDQLRHPRHLVRVGSLECRSWRDLLWGLLAQACHATAGAFMPGGKPS